MTNVDDILVLSLFFGRSAGQRGAARRITAGQYLGFTVLLAVTAAAYGATFLPGSAIAYLEFLPLALGLRAAWQARKDHKRDGDGEERQDRQDGPHPLQVAAVTFANGSDNIGVYLPVFARSGVAGVAVYAVVFLVLVGVWCAAGWFFATRPAVAGVIGRWGHIAHPVVLIALGLFILIQGGAFGLAAWAGLRCQGRPAPGWPGYADERADGEARRAGCLRAGIPSCWPRPTAC
ncbi:MAG TPA: cadmium resistance transporter [Streptosporangiaceae bacterium]|nr:cadmium resistance transporter [Streptosporangiaceae bacterium]